MQPTLKQQVSGRLLIIAATVIWGISFVVLKNTLDSIGPLWTMSIRFIIGALLIFAARFKKLKLIDKKHLAVGTALGFTLFGAYVFQTYGLNYTTPGKNAFLTAAYCVIVPFLGRLTFKTKLDRYNILAAFICIAGVGLVSLENDFSIALGDVLSICCSVFFALQILILDRYAPSMDVPILAAIQFAIGGILSLISAPIFEAPPSAISSDMVWGMLYLCVMCTAVAFLCQSIGQKYTPATSAAVLLSFEAVFGAIGSAVFYHEKMTVQLVAGFALIFIAVIISETKLKFFERPSDPRA